MGLKTQTLVQCLIECAECDSYRSGTRTDRWHVKADQKLLNKVGGLSQLLIQAKELERIAGISGKISVEWTELHRNIKKIIVSPEAIPLLCQAEKVEDPRERQKSQILLVENWKAEAKEIPWLLSYYTYILERLLKGEQVKSVPGLRDPQFFLFLNKAASIRTPIYRRVFSAQTCAEWKGRTDATITPTKRFEILYQTPVLSILKQYSPFYEEGMADEEILAAHGILTYAQTLEFKGALEYRIDDEPVLSSEAMKYGTVFNSQTLETAVPVSMKNIRRIMTIENKANYEKMDFDPKTLYIYCHGFLSPAERKFLSALVLLAAPDIAYFHWGDMDYGGIRIFLFLQKRLFPDVQPWKMDPEHYKWALETGAGIPLEAGKREKLEKLDAGMLTSLKEQILEHGQEIEQELLLL